MRDKIHLTQGNRAIFVLLIPRWSVPNPFPYYVSMIASWAFLGAVLIVGLLAYYLHQRRGYMSL